MQMMYQSFRMSNTNTVLPEQTIYPGLESTTSTLNSSSTVGVVLPPPVENNTSTTGNNN